MLLLAQGAARPVAAALAALLSERDMARTRPGERDADLCKRLELLDGRAVAGLEVDRGALERVRKLAREWQRGARSTGVPGAAVTEPDPGLLLACAYPDRIAKRRADSGRYLLANGRGAVFQGADGLAQHEFLVIATLDGGGREATIRLAAAVGRTALLRQFAGRIESVDRVEWSRRDAAVVARRERRLLALVLEESPLQPPPAERARAAMLDGIRDLGLEALPWTPAARAYCLRVAFVRAAAGPDGGGWPDLSTAALEATLEDWLAPSLDGITRRDHLARLDLLAILKSRLDHARQVALERLAPTHLVVPSGSRIAIDYAGEAPQVAVRLQEMFGLATTPLLAGRVPVTIQLLSPAGRPVQVTRDLASFWARGYAEVKRELKGRYPKHHWPDDPLAAQPTARARPRR
jgi:ATP-dependent helicase HrpB